MTAPIDEARLRELAEAATPGPWIVHEPRGQASLVVGREEVGPRHSLVKVLQPANAKNERGKNAAFIAAANPATILALLDALSAERERGDRAVGLLRRIDCSAIPIEMSSPLQWSVCGKAMQDAADFLATQKAEGV